jgi:hypothetical protein
MTDEAIQPDATARDGAGAPPVGTICTKENL